MQEAEDELRRRSVGATIKLHQGTVRMTTTPSTGGGIAVEVWGASLDDAMTRMIAALDKGR